MQQIENPFTDADRLLDEARREPLPPIRLVDFHCELTREKNALGLYLDGRVSAVVGHAHARRDRRRADPARTARPTRRTSGMTGPIWSVIGFDPRTVLPRFINALPTRFEVGSGPVIFNAAQIDIDPGDRARAPDRAHPAPARGLTRAWPGTGRRHAPLPPRRARVVPPAPSTVDLHAHTTRSDGVLAPADLRRAAAAAGVRHVRPHRPRHAGGVSRRRGGRRDRRPGMTLIPGVEINALVTRDLGLWEGELHILGFGMDPDDEAFEAALAAQRDRRRRVRFARTVERLREIGLPIDAQVAELAPGDDDALGRPTIARALMAAGLRDERRGRLPRLIGHGQPGYVPARRPGPGGGDPGDRRGGRRARPRPLPRGPDPDRAAARAHRGRAGRPRGPLPHVRRADDSRGRRGGRGARASSRPAAPTTTATSGRTPRPTPRLWVPPEVGERALLAPGRAGDELGPAPPLPSRRSGAARPAAPPLAPRRAG